jgi:hypothetical protein
VHEREEIRYNYFSNTPKYLFFLKFQIGIAEEGRRDCALGTVSEMLPKFLLLKLESWWAMALTVRDHMQGKGSGCSGK